MKSRPIFWALAAAGTVVAAGAVSASAQLPSSQPRTNPFAATPSAGRLARLPVATPLAEANVRQSYSIDVKKPAGILVVKATLPPGASFGWHSHSSAVAVVIAYGTLTLYDSAYPGCSAKRFSRGQGFVEPANHVHLARNEGGTPVVLYATYLGMPNGAPPNVPASRPSSCSA
jgi:quercetin dioxygenase-like cupin family protein